MRQSSSLVRNDPQQYNDLSASWWDERGPLASLQWIAESRARLIPPATADGALFVDVGCGGGLLAPFLTNTDYFHVGIDLNSAALHEARDHGASVIQGDGTRLPLPDECAAVVSAGEILEHVEDWEEVVAESCRVLRPGGWLILDTIANTRRARLLAIVIAERIPGGAPKGIHDHRLFIDRQRLVEVCARHGVELHLQGLRPSVHAYLAWALRLRRKGKMVPTTSTATLFQAWGRKTS